MNIRIDNDSALRAMKERLGGKTGLYKFLAMPGKQNWPVCITDVIVIENLYMPPFAQSSREHLYEIITGKKRAFFAAK